MDIKEIEPAGGWFRYYRKKENRKRRIDNIVKNGIATLTVLVIVAAFAFVETLEHI